MIESFNHEHISSLSELRRRVRKVQEDSNFLRKKLTPESPYNAVLRVVDITRYIGCGNSDLADFAPDAPPPKWKCACGSVEHCQRQPRCRTLGPTIQRKLSGFFRGWDSGALVKANVLGEWRVVSRHSSYATLAPVDAKAGAKIRPAIPMRIDPATLGLKVGKV
jgi:hypothetical protein